MVARRPSRVGDRHRNVSTSRVCSLAAFNKVFTPRPGVQKTSELSRILALPRRSLDLDAGTLDGNPIPDLSPLYVINPGRCSEHPSCPICYAGNAKLWPTQSAALLEAERGWGLFGPLGVGSGKTLVTLLLPDVLQSDRAVLLVPASLRNQLLSRDIDDYGRHFRLPIERLTVVAYTELSDAAHAGVLDRVAPDLIISDECHNLSRGGSARSKRFARYMRDNPSTRFCALSGTVTRRSLRDYAHLCEAALRAGSPVPFRWSDLNEWAEALDPIQNPLPIGALRAFADPSDIRMYSPDPDLQRDAARAGFQRRLVDTPGVVATSESWEGASLVVAALRPPLPKAVADALEELDKTWEVGGEEIEDIVRFVAAKRQLSLGFYYRWVWPDGVIDHEWMDARAAWHKYVRDVLRHRSRAGLDSPMLVARAVQQKRPDVRDGQDAWAAWDAVRGRFDPQPPTEAVWLSNYAIGAARAWAQGGGGSHTAGAAVAAGGIIWYSHVTVGEKLASLGLPIYGAGTDAGAADPAREPVIVCSIQAQGTGKNLQRYSRSLVLEPPASGTAWEQLLGRLHRPGQRADEVWFDVFMSTPELQSACVRAVGDAQYVQSTQGQRQKLLTARRVGW